MNTEQQLFEKRKYLKKTQVIVAAHKQFAFYLDKFKTGINKTPSGIVFT